MKRPAIAPAGIVLGLGLGGFLDGVVFHQILQLHGMLSAVVPQTTMAGMRTNMAADGVFHLATWAATLVGVALLWNALTRRADMRPSGKAFAGFLLAGWGWFNLIEGIIDHHMLNLHHVVERMGTSFWDGLYLASGVILIAAGHTMAARASRPDY